MILIFIICIHISYNNQGYLLRANVKQGLIIIITRGQLSNGNLSKLGPNFFDNYEKNLNMKIT